MLKDDLHTLFYNKDHTSSSSLNSAVGLKLTALNDCSLLDVFLLLLSGVRIPLGKFVGVWGVAKSWQFFDDDPTWPILILLVNNSPASTSTVVVLASSSFSLNSETKIIWLLAGNTLWKCHLAWRKVRGISQAAVGLCCWNCYSCRLLQ